MNQDIINWLQDDPCVKYWVLLDLLKKDPSSPEIKQAQEELMGSQIVRSIMQAQKPEGYWNTFDNMYLPKYTATTHSLLMLSELGAIITLDIKRGLEYVFKFQRDSGHFLTNLPKTAKGRASVVKDGCCLDGNVLFYMVHFGYLEDPRVGRLLDFIVDYHSTEDAGWKCRAFPINPEGVFPVNCYMGAIKVLKALSIIPVKDRTQGMNIIIEREVENILENGVYKYLRNPDGTRKEKAGWKRFGFPLFYQSDVLEVLDTLTRLGIHDERMQNSINLIKETQGQDGLWVLKNTYNGKMWTDIEEKGKPSRWITLKARRILENYTNR